MASFHMSIKNGKKGRAANHSAYIARQGKYGRNDKGEDLQLHQYGNLPDWANHQPAAFWSAADKFERSNGTTYVEYELALPRELSTEQRVELVQEFAALVGGNKPYELAIHEPEAGLGGGSQPHAHFMVNNRMPDGVDRSKELYFRRYNAAHPELGGCRKDSGGKHRGEMKLLANSMRETWADLQNKHLKKHGHLARVDHRSYQSQGVDKIPERHLGYAKIKKMSEHEVGEILQKRRS